ncbi:hypothetical protein D8I24_0531 (plasmid) [Cupriavidus necator H850]|nr:hypothetical protein D8I24_0531 [Cupriavidus necator H850]
MEGVRTIVGRNAVVPRIPKSGMKNEFMAAVNFQMASRT